MVTTDHTRQIIQQFSVLQENLCSGYMLYVSSCVKSNRVAFWLLTDVIYIRFSKSVCELFETICVQKYLLSSYIYKYVSDCHLFLKNW